MPYSVTLKHLRLPQKSPVPLSAYIKGIDKSGAECPPISLTEFFSRISIPADIYFHVSLKIRWKYLSIFSDVIREFYQLDCRVSHY